MKLNDFLLAPWPKRLSARIGVRLHPYASFSGDISSSISLKTHSYTTELMV